MARSLAHNRRSLNKRHADSLLNSELLAAGESFEILTFSIKFGRLFQRSVIDPSDLNFHGKYNRNAQAKVFDDL